MYNYQVQPQHNYTGINIDLPYTIGYKNPMKVINKNQGANFYISSSYNSIDRILPRIQDKKSEIE